MIRVGHPDLELGDVNGRAVICTISRADSDANTLKNRCRAQAVAEGIMNRIRSVSSNEEHGIAFTVRSETLDVQDNGKWRGVLRVHHLVGKVRGDIGPVYRYRDARCIQTLP